MRDFLGNRVGVVNKCALRDANFAQRHVFKAEKEKNQKQNFNVVNVTSLQLKNH